MLLKEKKKNDLQKLTRTAKVEIKTSRNISNKKPQPHPSTILKAQKPRASAIPKIQINSPNTSNFKKCSTPRNSYYSTKETSFNLNSPLNKTTLEVPKTPTTRRNNSVTY